MEVGQDLIPYWPQLAGQARKKWGLLGCALLLGSTHTHCSQCLPPNLCPFYCSQPSSQSRNSHGKTIPVPQLGPTLLYHQPHTDPRDPIDPCFLVLTPQVGLGTLCPGTMQAPHREILINLPLHSTLQTLRSRRPCLCTHVCIHVCHTFPRNSGHVGFRPESCDCVLWGCPRNPRGRGRNPHPAGF